MDMEAFKNILFSEKSKYEESVLVSTYFYSDRPPLTMSKGRKVLAYLENATSISLECSDVESELYDSDGEFLDRQNDPQGSDDESAIIESSDEEILDEENIDRSSDSDCEKIPNKRTRRCVRFPSSSEDEGGSNVPNHETESDLDGTIWTRIVEGGVAEFTNSAPIMRQKMSTENYNAMIDMVNTPDSPHDEFNCIEKQC
uniref:Uncharacterized protein n=1 Tax=Glossina pallidipes TaxID=7398 RepID=A0A1A9ZCP4_GLOPL